MNRALATVRPRVLLLCGGWAGHQPEMVADFARTQLLDSCEVTESQNLSNFAPDVLRDFDVLLPLWTFGEINDAQEASLLQAVEQGLGVVAWHGAASAFLQSRRHKHLLGGQFVAHPGNDNVDYEIRFLADDALVAGLATFTVCSEQYYMLIDPAVQVLAVTRMQGANQAWLSGVEMPVMWKRHWGRGRVFYSSLGHSRDVLELPQVRTVLHRALRWAVRGGQAAPAKGLEPPRSA